MAGANRLVVDTNVVVSALLFPGKIPSRALLKAQAGIVLASSAMREELAEVMNRSRFDHYVEPEIRRRLVAAYLDATVMVEIPHAIRACRDPRDDKFLEAAVHGRADLILTGDADLLTLHPFRGISIVTPAEFLERA